MSSEESSGPSSDQTITEHELEECKKANATGRPPVVFVHGLWLLPSSWDRWAKLFEENGYAALTPGWPDDPETVEEAKAHPEVFAGKSIGQVADHFETIIRGLNRKPAVIGHSFGGLLTQILAGRGLAAVSVAIDPAPFRGVLPLPIHVLRVVHRELLLQAERVVAAAGLLQVAHAQLGPALQRHHLRRPAFVDRTQPLQQQHLLSPTTKRPPPAGSPHGLWSSARCSPGERSRPP